MKKVVTSVLILLVFVSKNIAQKAERFTDYKEGSDLQDSAVIDAFDDKYFGIGADTTTIEQTYTAKGVLVFEFDPKLNNIVDSDSFSCDIELEIIDYSSGTDSTSTLETMSLNINPLNPSYKNKAILYFDPTHRLHVSVSSISYLVGGSPVSPIPDVFRLRAEIYVFRNYNFNCADLSTLSNDTYNSNYDWYTLHWTPIGGATNYDLEWTFYDSLSVLNTYSPCTSYPSTRYGELFQNNSTRISTSDLDYNITAAYAVGCLVCRVRGIQSLPSYQRLATDWSYLIFSTGDFQQSLNRQVTTTFAEEGMKKEVLDYFDGSLRNRQSVTRDNTSDSSIVAETIYDFHGRPAVKVLPVPAFDGNVKYHHKFNVDSTYVSYTWLNFDTSDCGAIPQEMNDTSGAARYYSHHNPDSSKSPDKFLPESQGYPFSVTEYTQDLTGRVQRQSGVGKDLKLGSSHESKYYYARPSQGELDRLFGNDAGEASHYTEEMSIDPNGQISITYKNLLNDKIIATSLAGPAPGNLEQLPDFRGDSIFKTTFIDDRADDNIPMSLKTSYEYLAKSQDTFMFRYTLIPDSFTTTNCYNTTICFNCLYDITVRISDHCSSSPLFERTYHNYSFPLPYDTACTLPDSSISDSVALSLTWGTYYTSREIQVSDSGLDFYTNQYMARDTCKSFADFYNDQFNLLLAASGCDITCENCLSRLGARDTFIVKFLAQIEVDGYVPNHRDSANANEVYDLALRECQLLCNPLDECAAKFEIMLQDMSPGGQYARYDVDSMGQYSVSDRTSIFNIGGTNGYRYIDVHYLDSDGNQIYDTTTGVHIRPDLLSISDFIDRFDKSWAYSLVKIHPEYCYYNFCIENSDSHEYDYHMLMVDDYQTAVASGYFDPKLHDPFFVTGSGSGTSVLTKLDNELNHYKIIYPNGYSGDLLCPYTLSIWQFAMLVSLKITPNPTLPCHINFPDTSSLCTGDKNMYWRIFRALYFSVKHQLFYQCERRYVMDSCTNGYSCNLCIGSDLAQFITLGFRSDTSDHCRPCTGYGEKTPRFLGMAPHAQFLANINSATQANNWLHSTMDTLVGEVCHGYRDYWRDKLLQSCSPIDWDTLRMILDTFEVLCRKGVDVTHPMGASTLNPDSAYTYSSFEAVLDSFLHRNSNPPDPYCNALAINIPRPYGEPPLLVNMSIFPSPPQCTCHKLDSLFILFFTLSGQTTLDSFVVFLDTSYGSTLTAEQISEMRMICHNNGCQTLSEPIALPQVLSCDSCLTCDSVSNAFISFCDGFTDGARTPGFQNLFASFCNQRFGFNLLYDQYINFLDSCRYLDPDSLGIISCDSLALLYTYYLSFDPRPELDDWFNTHLGYHNPYRYGTYRHWLVSCGLDTSQLSGSTAFSSRRSNPKVKEEKASSRSILRIFSPKHKKHDQGLGLLYENICKPGEKLSVNIDQDEFFLPSTGWNWKNYREPGKRSPNNTLLASADAEFFIAPAAANLKDDFQPQEEEEAMAPPPIDSCAELNSALIEYDSYFTGNHPPLTV